MTLSFLFHVLQQHQHAPRWLFGLWPFLVNSTCQTHEHALYYVWHFLFWQRLTMIGAVLVCFMLRSRCTRTLDAFKWMSDIRLSLCPKSKCFYAFKRHIVWFKRHIVWFKGNLVCLIFTASLQSVTDGLNSQLSQVVQLMPQQKLCWQMTI